MSISLPVFCAADSDSDLTSFFEAAAMNEFYKKAAELILPAASKLTQDKKAKFSCSFRCEKIERGLAVTLYLARSVRGNRSKRKEITHIWQSGKIISG